MHSWDNFVGFEEWWEIAKDSKAVEDYEETVPRSGTQYIKYFIFNSKNVTL